MHPYGPDKYVSLWRKGVARLLAGLCGIGVLAGCVTETSGGFGVQASSERAQASYLQLAEAYLAAGDLANARRHLGNAAGIDPGDATGVTQVLAIQALIHAREGEPTRAEAAFRQALRLDPHAAKARNNYAALLYAQGRVQEACEALRQVVRDRSYAGRAQAFENLGLCALRLGRMDEAEQAFERALQLNGNQRRASLELAVLNLQQHNLDDAERFYGNFMSLMQLNEQSHTPRSLWIGVQVEHALGNAMQVRELAHRLETTYRSSAEYQLYRQFLEDPHD